jgi:hypothetical protein
MLIIKADDFGRSQDDTDEASACCKQKGLRRLPRWFL